MKKLLIIAIALVFNISSSQAACNFIINIGEKGTKVFNKFAMPMPTFNGQFMLPIQSTEVCPNDNLGEMIAVEYVFLGENEEDANLAAIRMVVLNDDKNTESEKLTLMNYAKKVYGDFDTGQNPKAFNNFYVWEKNQNLIIYKRMLNPENLIEEEIMITNDEYDRKLGEFYNNLEMEVSEGEQQ